MRYAKIMDNVVIQIQPNKAIGFIEVGEGVVCGMVKDGDSFTVPQRTTTKADLQQAVYKKLDVVTAKLLYNEARYGNQPQYTVSYDSKKIELIAEQAELIQKLKEL